MLWTIVIILLAFSALFFSLGINYYAILLFSVLSADRHTFLRYGLTFLLSLVTAILLFLGRFEIIEMPLLLYGGITGVSFGAVSLHKTYEGNMRLALVQVGGIVIRLALYSFAGIVLAYLCRMFFNYAFTQMVGLF